MPDIRNIRSRAGVRIYLHPADIASILTQDDVLKSLSNEELETIVFSVSAEIQDRKQ